MGELKAFLDDLVAKYNQPDFIPNDPISIPRRYSKSQDIEITGFVAAMLAWGQRKTIINKCTEFFAYMDHAPHDFILNHSEDDLKPFLQFKHRTFNPTDALYFISFFQWHYHQYSTLEEAFITPDPNPDMSARLTHFFHHFFSLPDHPTRTYKHIPSPIRNSACKRMNMFLRWMVRKDDSGVDFGLWSKISPAELICPCDLHVDRVARRLGLITRKQTDWKTAMELTENLRKMDPNDPVKYDFALFGLGIEERYPSL
ncbi:MAG: TIGR02757 family protein [Cyclobacteriaceae bacterium]